MKYIVLYLKVVDSIFMPGCRYDVSVLSVLTLGQRSRFGVYFQKNNYVLYVGKPHGKYGIQFVSDELLVQRAANAIVMPGKRSCALSNETSIVARVWDRFLVYIDSKVRCLGGSLDSVSNTKCRCFENIRFPICLAMKRKLFASPKIKTLKMNYDCKWKSLSAFLDRTTSRQLMFISHNVHIKSCTTVATAAYVVEKLLTCWYIHWIL